MVFDPIFQRFFEDSPVSVMFRATMENVFSAERMDRIFGESAERQVERTLLFSTCADILSLVVASMRKSVNAAYQAQRKAGKISVSVKSLYNKLAGIEPCVSERMVRETSAALAEVITEMKGTVKGPLPGYDVRILDGNHLAGSEHRLAELRSLGAAALPGLTMVVLNPQRLLLEDVVAWEDGHANERVLLPFVLQRVQARQCWIADSVVCTLAFLFGFREQKAFFIFRQHGALKGELLGKRKRLGRCATGVVYEQTLRLTDRQHGVMDVRRITIVRDQPTDKGVKEIHLVTNLPAKVGGRKIAEAYRQRWKIETAFQDLATTLRSEINTLGYPDAALFGFCIGLVLSNVVSTLKAALRTAAGGEKKLERNLSSYYLADEISGVSRGMEIAVPADCWTAAFASLTPKQLAKTLLWLARKVDLKMFYTNPWTPKRPQPKKISGHRGNHVSTQRILDQRKKQLNC